MGPRTVTSGTRCLKQLILAFLLWILVEGNRGPTALRQHRGYRQITLAHLNESEMNNQSNDKQPVPPPVNLEIRSYNFITSIKWEYTVSSLTPYFQVEVKNYQTGDNWTIVNNCRKTSHNYCDLSKKISPRDPNAFYNVRVKAFLGTEESEYATKKDFCLRIDGIIGPPTLNATQDFNNIILNIWHPPAPPMEKKLKTIGDIYDDFNYIVFVNGTNHFEHVQNCDGLGCTVYITPPSKEDTVCFSARGSSKHWAVTGEKSKELCISVQGENGIKVPIPFDLEIRSYNFNTTVFWKYDITSVVPYFQVEVTSPSTGAWTVVNGCKRILHTHCDLSKKIRKPNDFYNVRVKAFVGMQVSEYARRRDFCLRIDGIIGPPILNVTNEDNKIILDILHPRLHSVKEEQMTVVDFYDDFNYDLFVNGIKSEYVTDGCDELVCTVIIVPPPTEKKICLSAEGYSSHWAVRGERSMERCILLHEEQSTGLQLVIIPVLVLTLVLVLLLGFLLFYKTLIKHNKLPESLLFSAENPTARLLLLSETSTVSQLSTTPTRVLIDTMEEDQISQTETSSITASQEYGGTEYERAVAESEPSQFDDDQNWIHLEPDKSRNCCGGSLVNADNDGKDSGISVAAETQENDEEENHLSETKCNSNSYGYDKPHVPLDLLLQMNNEE
uniref:Uncharacterized protein n=1 Tax=Leptobrachium leishanense TaxID=445787 RepID=A0A8C5QND3_9ANUR